MWAWGIGGLVAAGGVGFVLSGGPTCHCGPCLGRADDDAIVAAAPIAPVRPVRFDEPPLAKVFRLPPTGPRPSSPADPF